MALSDFSRLFREDRLAFLHPGKELVILQRERDLGNFQKKVSIH